MNGLPAPTQPQGFGSYEAYAASQPGFWESLWGGLKSIAKPVAETGVKLFETYLEANKPADKTNIAYQIPNYGQNQIPGPNYQFYTPYPREDNSATPASVVVGGATGAGGIPSSYLLIGVALIAFMMMKKR